MSERDLKQTGLHIQGKTQALLAAGLNYADYIYLAHNLSDFLHLNHSLISTGQKFSGLGFPDTHSNFSSDAHFGCDKSAVKAMSKKYKICTGGTPALQASAIISGPTTSTSANDHSSGSCTRGIPPVVVIKSTNPLNFDVSNALYKKEIFWALPVLDFEDQKEKAIWSYMVQMILVQFDHNLMLTNVLDNRLNPQIKIAELVDKKSASIIRNIIKVIFRNAKDLKEVFQGVFDKVVGQNLLSEQRVKEQKKWIEIILKLYSQQFQKWFNMNQLSCSTNVIFSPWTFEHNSEGSPTIQNFEIIRDVNEETCQFTKMPKKISGQYKEKPFHNVALIVVYSKPVETQLPFVETLYRPYFPIIVHCSLKFAGANRQKKVSDLLEEGWKAIYVEHIYNETLSYQCIRMAINLRLQVEGYLFINSDVIVSKQTFNRLTLKRIWIELPSFQCSTVGKESCKINKDGASFQSIAENMERMKNLYQDIKRKRNYFFNSCKRQMRKLTGYGNSFFGGRVHFYYMPHSTAIAANHFLDHFLNNQVPVDITVPTILNCLGGKRNIFDLHEFKPNVEDQKKRFAGLDEIKTGEFTHLYPAPWIQINSRSQIHVNAYCEKVIPYFYT